MAREISPEQINCMAARTEFERVLKSELFKQAEAMMEEAVLLEMGREGIDSQLLIMKAERLLSECGYYTALENLECAEDQLILWSHRHLKQMHGYKARKEKLEMLFAGYKVSAGIREHLVACSMAFQPGAVPLLLANLDKN